jgi:glutamate racemase
MLPTPRLPSDGAIGLFDSGVGGLSVWREVARLLPHEDTLYLADQAHVPYGSRSAAEVRGFARAITRYLLGAGAKVVVVACNTASAAALLALRAELPGVPIVGMEPAVKPAVERTQTGVVGVLATPATFHGELFASLLDRYAGDVRVLAQTCPGLVEAVETGTCDAPATETQLRACLAPLLAAGIDQLVLGCTHYPFLAPQIARIVGPGVALVDPAPAVARQTARVLAERGLARGPHTGGARHTFCTSGEVVSFGQALARLVACADGRCALQALRWQADGSLQATAPQAAGDF